MTDKSRYSCQIALPGFSEQAQQKLAHAKVLIVGAGGLGCPAAQYLTSCGVGTIAIADDDVVSVSNLHRQILYTPADESRKKAEAAAEILQAQNPGVTIIPIDSRISAQNVIDIVSNYDIVVDCTDNFETRYLLNDACVLADKPLVYGAIYQYEGQVAVWNIVNKDGSASPNYRDLYADVNAAAVPNCADGGVMPTIAGIIGCMQANEVIKYITNTGDLLAGRLLLFDAHTMQSRMLKLGTVTKTNITKLVAEKAIPEISFEELQNNIDKYTLIDVRNGTERAAYHIGGLHIPLPEVQSATIQTGKPIVCYCASGVRSKEAVKVLQRRFHASEIYSLQGGISGINAI